MIQCEWAFSNANISTSDAKNCKNKVRIKEIKLIAILWPNEKWALTCQVDGLRLNCADSQSFLSSNRFQFPYLNP